MTPPFTTRVSRAGAGMHGVLALLAFVPLLLTRTGRVAADTRQYLFLDPGAFLDRSFSLWDSHVHLGTVTHSNIGNVFPMGTFFTATDAVGIPAWVAQRLWLGLLLFAAGAGMLFLVRTLRWRGPGVMVAALAYMLSPYALQYSSRTSVLLLPFAALPWMVGLTERALRTGGWRHPALLGLVAVLTAGSNVAALALVALGPLLWVVMAVARHDVPRRQAAGTLLRTGAITVGTCALWLTALLVESRHGVDVLAYTETLEQVSTTSTAPEALRGLGYWLFYGTEARQPNVGAAVDLLESTPVLLAGYLLAGLGILSAFTVRWRQRSFAIALVVLGVVVAVGAYPVAEPSLLGRAYRDVSDSSSIALALRSSTRAVPLVVLGVAMLLAAGVNALTERRRAWGVGTAVVAVALVLGGAPALFSGDYVDAHFSRPSDVPGYWKDVARALDDAGIDTRTLEIPGSQFAAYRWGITYETPVLAALLDGPSVAREQIPYGSPPAADLLSALDHRIQEGTLDPASLAPLARLMNAAHVLLRSDLEFERYVAPRPRALWALLSPAPAGLDEPTGYGTPTENRPDPSLPLIDAQALAIPADADDPPPVVVFPVDGVRPILHAQDADSPVVLDGDGDGIVDAAAAGVIDGDELLLYAASLDRRALDAALARGATIVVTDTNRRRERRWRSTRFTTGLTDRAGRDQPTTGHGEADLDVFPDATDDDRSVAVQRGATVDASGYGTLVTFDTDQRAANALDGDPRTAWEIGTTSDPVGEHLAIRSDEPVRTGYLDLLQAQGGFRTRVVSEVMLRFDGGRPLRRVLDDSSLTAPGQRIEFASREFTELDLEITATRETADVVARGGSPSGFAEVSIPGLRFDELVRLPVGLVRATGSDSLEHALVYVMTRLRANPAERNDEEARIARILEVPATRTFSVQGDARVSAVASDDAVEQTMGIPGTAAGAARVRSSGSLAGTLDQRGRAALDGDRTTHWTGTFAETAGSWLDVELAQPRTLGHLDLALLADGRHSVPTRLRIEAGGESRDVELPPLRDEAEPDAVVDAAVDFAPLTGSRFRITITGVREVTSADAFSGRQLPLPVSIAELGIPGAVTGSAPAQVPGECRDDLVTIDGDPVAVRVVGTTDGALRRDRLAVESCNGPLTLEAGRHTVRTAAGAESGLDLDRIVLASGRGGDTVAPSDATGRAGSRSPRVEVLETSATEHRVSVPAHDDGIWLVLGESQNDGWHAEIDGGRSLGEPTLVNGYANGWFVPAADREQRVRLTWTPQGPVNLAVVVSILVVLLSMVLVARGRRWDPAAARDVPAIDLLSAPAVATRTDRRSLVLIPLAAGAFAWLVVEPLPALGVAAVVALALVWRYGRILLATLALALVAAGFLGVVRAQAREDRVVGYEWTTGQENEHRAVLVGLSLLAAEPLVRARRTSPDRTHDEDEERP